MIEAYGKLPFYKDFISVIGSKEATGFKTWLLQSFQGELPLPAGLWPFVFQQEEGAASVVGLIMESSDGIRGFPFSIFVVCGDCRKGSGYRQDMLQSLWSRLEVLMPQLQAVGDINSLYAMLRGKAIAPDGGGLAAVNQEKFPVGGSGVSWPRLLVAKKSGDPLLYPLMAGRLRDGELLDNWGKLAERVENNSIREE